jgi:hypothetical protein
MKRIKIPKVIRKAAQLTKGSLIKIRSKGKTVIIEPVEPVADKYFSAFKVSNWPEDLDEFVVVAKENWRKKNATIR